MTQPDLPWEGGCRCDGVRFRISKAPLLTGACHCSGCKRMSSSAFSLAVVVPVDGFAVTKGTPVVGGIHAATRHMFCPHCMTWMFTHPEGIDAIVNVRATLLDDHAWFTPFVETFTKTKLPWVKLPTVRSYDEFPPLEAYAGLIEEFGKRVRG